MNIPTKIRRVRFAAATMPLVALAACSFEVTNPGPVQEKFLDDPAAQTAIVNGAGRDLSDALNWIAYTGAAVSREIFPAGSTGSFGITVNQQLGKLTEEESDAYWDRAHRARFEAEDGADRFRRVLQAGFATSRNAAQILLWAAHANRLLGENMCDAVIDGGPRQAFTVHLERAEDQLTEAMAIAAAVPDTRLVQAAQAARASVRATLGDWTGAAADAASIPDAFGYSMPYYTTDADQYNRIYWAVGNNPYRAHTVWNTVYEQYYTDTSDPRVAWGRSTTQPVGDGAVLTIGQVPWHFETKFNSRTSAINLSSGWEMRLIEAEALLVAGNFATAMPLINKHRLALGLQPWTATTLEEAWTALKRERGIELWLEGRRLGDLRRWEAADRPGTLSAYEVPGTTSYLDASRSLCFPIPLSELQTNPNLDRRSAGP